MSIFFQAGSAQKYFKQGLAEFPDFLRRQGFFRFCVQEDLVNFLHARSAEKISGKVRLIGSRISSRG